MKPLKSPSATRQRMKAFQYVANAIEEGLSGNRFHWGSGEYDAFVVKAQAMGITLVTKTKIERDGYRLKRGAQPIGSAYFGAPISRDCKLYVLECQCEKIANATPAEDSAAKPD